MVLKQQFIFLRHCANFDTQRQSLFDNAATIDVNILTENVDGIVNTLLYEKTNSEISFNKAMLNMSTEFFLPCERSNNLLF